MKKLSTLFTTTLLALGLMAVTPAAIANPKDGKDYNNLAIFICVWWQTEYPVTFDLTFENFGQCVKFQIHRP